MIYPSIQELTKDKFNKYTLVIATAKCARLVTTEYTKQRDVAERMIANKETEKSLASMIKKEYRDEKAVKLAIDAGKISTSLMQRNLGVGYGRAAKIIDQMEDLGYVSPPDGNKPRRVLITMQEFMEKVVNDDLDVGTSGAAPDGGEE